MRGSVTLGDACCCVLSAMCATNQECTFDQLRAWCDRCGGDFDMLLDGLRRVEALEVIDGVERVIFTDVGLEVGDRAREFASRHCGEKWRNGINHTIEQALDACFESFKIKAMFDQAEAAVKAEMHKDEQPLDLKDLGGRRGYGDFSLN